MNTFQSFFKSETLEEKVCREVIRLEPSLDKWSVEREVKYLFDQSGGHKVAYLKANWQEAARQIRDCFLYWENPNTSFLDSLIPLFLESFTYRNLAIHYSHLKEVEIEELKIRINNCFSRLQSTETRIELSWASNSTISLSRFSTYFQDQMFLMLYLENKYAPSINYIKGQLESIKGYWLHELSLKLSDEVDLDLASAMEDDLQELLITFLEKVERQQKELQIYSSLKTYLNAFFIRGRRIGKIVKRNSWIGVEAENVNNIIGDVENSSNDYQTESLDCILNCLKKLNIKCYKKLKEMFEKIREGFAINVHADNSCFELVRNECHCN